MNSVQMFYPARCHIHRTQYAAKDQPVPCYGLSRGYTCFHACRGTQVRHYQDPISGELWCEVKKDNTTVHRKAIVTCGDRSIPSSMRDPLHRVEPKLYEGERLVTTLTDMEIIQEKTHEQRPRTSNYFGSYEAYDPDNF